MHFIRLWDTSTGKQIREIKFDKGDYSRLVFAPSGTVLATIGEERFFLWEVSTGKLLKQLKLSAGAFLDDGKTLVMVDGVPATKVRFWDIATGKCVREWDAKGAIQKPPAQDAQGAELDGLGERGHISRRWCLGGTHWLVRNARR